MLNRIKNIQFAKLIIGNLQESLKILNYLMS